VSFVREKLGFTQSALRKQRSTKEELKKPCDPRAFVWEKTSIPLSAQSATKTEAGKIQAIKKISPICKQQLNNSICLLFVTKLIKALLLYVSSNFRI
jgi:hypothetical protein